jgi:tRNA-5-methyluridine54 2-sulfurtransferase
MCKICNLKPVFKLDSGEQLCKSCFLRYFEKKVRKTLRVHKLINNGDRIGVAISGGKDSLTVLDLLHKIYKNNPSVELTGLLVDEGIKDYRDKSIVTAKSFCKDRGISLKIVSYNKEFGFDLDNVVEGKKPCSVCGVLRRNLLNKYARELGVNKLATGHNLDDEVQVILMNQFRKNISASARLGPITGIKDHELFVRRIKPLYLVSEKEVMIYAYLKGITDEFNECPYNKVSYRNQVRELINSFEDKFPGTKHSILNSFLEILPLLKSGSAKKGKINKCLHCSEPTSKDICQKCLVLDQIKSS